MENKYCFKYISDNRNIILGIATLLIAFVHSQSLYLEKVFSIDIINNFFIFLKNFGTYGVDIFLVLSGVGLYYSFSKNNNIRTFYKKRIKRILPSVIIVAVIITALAEGKGIGNFLQRIFLISFFTKGDLDFWYFSLIIFLYIIYPLLHMFIEKYGLKAVIVMIIVVLGINFSIMIWNNEVYNRLEIALTRIPVFIVGIWLGKLAKDQVKISKKWLVAVLVLFAIIVYILANYSFVDKYYIVRYLFCPFAVTTVILLSYIYTWIKKENFFTKFFIWIGTYSMEIYLLYEYLMKHCNGFFKFDDSYNISYHICIFLITIILSIGLKKICLEINEKL